MIIPFQVWFFSQPLYPAVMPVITHRTVSGHLHTNYHQLPTIKSGILINL